VHGYPVAPITARAAEAAHPLVAPVRRPQLDHIDILRESRAGHPIDSIEVLRALESAGHEDVATGIDRHRVARIWPVVPHGRAEVLRPAWRALGGILGHKCRHAAAAVATEHRGTTKAHPANEGAGHDDVVAGIDRDAVTDVVVAAAETLRPLAAAGRR